MSAERDGRVPQIARRVREHRRRGGMTQVELAARVGRSPMWVDRLEHGDLEWIARLESGLVEPSEIPVLTDVACVLGITLAELVGPGVVMFPAAEPRPARRVAALPALPRPPARAVAVGVAVAVATGAAGLGLARAHSALTAWHPQDHTTTASARLVPASPHAVPSSEETGVAVAVETPTPEPATTPAAAPTAPPAAPPPPPARRPAPAPSATPAPSASARLAAATPAARPPAGVSVFPWALTASVAAGNATSSPVLTFTVTNPGDAAESLGAISLTNQAAHVVRDGCGHAVLAAGAQCHISVRIGSPTPGRYTGPLVVAVNGARATAVPIDIEVH